MLSAFEGRPTSDSVGVACCLNGGAALQIGPEQQIKLKTIRTRIIVDFFMFLPVMDIVYPKDANGSRSFSTPVYPGLSPVGSLAYHFAGIEVPHTSHSPEKLAIDSATALNMAHRYADSIEITKPELAGFVRRATNGNYLASLVNGNKRGVVSDLAVSQVIGAFSDEFTKKTGFPSHELDKLWLDTVGKLETHRSLGEGDDYYTFVYSLGNALAYIKNKLPQEHRETFEKLRPKYGLDTDSVRAFEREAIRTHFHPIANLNYRNVEPGKENNEPLVIESWKWKFPEEVPQLKGGTPTAEDLAQTANRKHTYKTSRGMRRYQNKLPSGFVEVLSSFNPNSHWIDVGSGEGKALWQYVNRDKVQEVLANYDKTLADPDYPEGWKADLRKHKEQWKKFLPLPTGQVTGVTLQMKREISAEEKGKVDYKIGKFIEDIPNSEFGTADLITDVVGAFAYANQVDVVLDKYLSILKPKGVILIGTDDDKGKVKRKDGTVVSICEWVDSIPGLDVELKYKKEDRPYYEPRVRIRKNANASIAIPKLKLFLSDKGTPPRRLYIEQ